MIFSLKETRKKILLLVTDYRFEFFFSPFFFLVCDYIRNLCAFSKLPIAFLSMHTKLCGVLFPTFKNDLCCTQNDSVHHLENDRKYFSLFIKDSVFLITINI